METGLSTTKSLTLKALVIRLIAIQRKYIPPFATALQSNMPPGSMTSPLWLLIWVNINLSYSKQVCCVFLHLLRVRATLLLPHHITKLKMWVNKFSVWSNTLSTSPHQISLSSTIFYPCIAPHEKKQVSWVVSRAPSVSTSRFGLRYSESIHPVEVSFSNTLHPKLARL